LNLFVSTQQSQLIFKVDVLRDSHKLLVTPYREFEQQFGGKTVLAGLRLKKQFFPLNQVIFILAHPRRQSRIVARRAHEEMELISTCHFNKFWVWSQKSCGNLILRLL
jgi:hypothetical protein